MILTLVKCPSRVASQTYRRTYSDHNSHSRGQGAVWQWENSSTTCKRDSFVTLLAFCASCTKSNRWNIESEGKKIQITDTSREVSITKIRQMLSKPFMNYYFKHFCYWCTLVNYWCQKSRHQNIWQSCPSWQMDCWALLSQSCGYWTMGEMWVPLLMPESVFCNYTYNVSQRSTALWQHVYAFIKWSVFLFSLNHAHLHIVRFMLFTWRKHLEKTVEGCAM